MKSAAGCFLGALIVSAVLTPLVRRFAESRGLLDDADGRLKVHRGGIARIGGIAVVAGFFAPLPLLFLLDTGAAGLLQADLVRFGAFCAGGLVIFALGLWDDLRGAGALLKFTVETLVAVGVWCAGFRIETVGIPFLGPVDLGPFGLLVTIAWIVGITNALNLVDGLDGLAAGIALLAAGAHVVIGALNGNGLLTLFSAALTGAVLGFLPHNFNPARIFIGDCGALFLGYTLAVASIYGASVKGSTAVAVLGPVLILGLPILDTFLALARRVVRGQPVFDGDREHVHHVLLQAGLSHRRSAVVLFALSAAFALAGLMATAAVNLPTALVLVSLLVILVLFESRLGLLRRLGTAPESGPDPALAHLAALREAVRGARSPEAAWEALVARADDLQLHELRLSEPAGAREWRRPGISQRPREGVVRSRVPLGGGGDGPPLGMLEVGKRPFRRGSRAADDLFAALLEEYLREWPEAERAQERVELAPKARQPDVRAEAPRHR